MARPRLYLTPYIAGDIDRFEARGDFAAERAAVGWTWADGPPPGSTWTLCRAVAPLSQVIGVGGVCRVGDVGLHAWALLSDLNPRELLEAARLASDVLTSLERFRRADTITATARTALPGAVRLLERIGFRSQFDVTDERMPQVIYRLMARRAA